MTAGCESLNLVRNVPAGACSLATRTLGTLCGTATVGPPMACGWRSRWGPAACHVQWWYLGYSYRVCLPGMPLAAGMQLLQLHHVISPQDEVTVYAASWSEFPHASSCYSVRVWAPDCVLQHDAGKHSSSGRHYQACSRIGSGVAVSCSSCPIKVAWPKTPMSIMFSSMAVLLRQQHHASHNIAPIDTRVWLCGAQSSCPIYVNKVVWAKSATSIARLVAGQVEPETVEELSTTAALTTIRCGSGAYKLGVKMKMGFH